MIRTTSNRNDALSHPVRSGTTMPVMICSLNRSMGRTRTVLPSIASRVAGNANPGSRHELWFLKEQVSERQPSPDIGGQEIALDRQLPLHASNQGSTPATDRNHFGHRLAAFRDHDAFRPEVIQQAQALFPKFRSAAPPHRVHFTPPSAPAPAGSAAPACPSRPALRGTGRSR